MRPTALTLNRLAPSRWLIAGFLAAMVLVTIASAAENNPVRTRPKTQEQEPAQRVIVKFRQASRVSTQATTDGESGSSTATATAAGNAHRHPGFVLGYVLEGAYVFGVNSETPRIIRAGEAFFEGPGALHSSSASADPDRPAHLLAFMVVPAGQDLVLPA